MKSLTPVIAKSIAFIIVTVFATAVLAATIRNVAGGETDTYTGVFTDVTSLHTGDDVRMSGVKVGSVEDITIVETNKAQVTFTVDSAVTLQGGTELHLRFRNLVGERYIEVQQGADPGPLEPGHAFSAEETRPALDLTMLFNGFQPLMRMLSPEDVNNLSYQVIRVFQGEGTTVEELVASTASLTRTIADRDEVIGDLIDNLNDVLAVLSERSDDMDTTIVTLDAFVTAMADDREVLGSALEGMGDLTVSVADLLEEGRQPLKDSIDALGLLSRNLSAESDVLDDFFETWPAKLDAIGRLGSYGSWLNFYLCEISGDIPDPEGYMGDIGANPIAARCSQ